MSTERRNRTVEPKYSSRSWILTLPASEYDQETVEGELSAYAYVGQLESGDETGYEHWQVYIENRTPVRFDTLKSKFPKGHFESRAGSKWQAYQYVTKADTFLGVRIGSEEFVIPEPDGGRSMSVETIRKKMISEGVTFRDLILKEPLAAHHVNYARELEAQLRAETCGNSLREVEVEYVFGDAGAGKTKSVYERFAFRDVYSVGSYRNPFDAYNFEPVLVLDEFRGQIEFEFLLKLLDRYPLQLPARYADRWAAFERVILLSNLPIEECYPYVYAESPSQWAALRRRIGVYEQMFEGGVKVPLELPETCERLSDSEFVRALGVD